MEKEEKQNWNMKSSRIKKKTRKKQIRNLNKI